ncbi:MAG: type II toxin-antitoxin system VapC family toxin [Candidatus Hodarchaeales archaeon]|jgi:predicted nucleic acid-binding protein
MKILDTSVLIDLDRNPELFSASIDHLQEESDLYISSVTVFELWWGVYLTALKKKENNYFVEFSDFISPFVVVEIDTPIAIEASTIGVDLRIVGKTIDLHDLYIAATAKRLDTPLVTSNIKHYESITNIKIVEWPIV